MKVHFLCSYLSIENNKDKQLKTKLLKGGCSVHLYIVIKGGLLCSNALHVIVFCVALEDYREEN